MIKILIALLFITTPLYAENYHIMIDPKFSENQSWSGNSETFGQHKWSEREQYVHIFLSKKELVELVDTGQLFIKGGIKREE